MRKFATKSPAEKEQEEAQRLIRKSPTKKPPRTDKTRQRIQIEDEDLDTEDKDLSMNYKVIGGSTRKKLARYVAYRYAVSQEEDPKFIKWLNTEVTNPDTDREVKIKTLRKAPDGSPAKDKYNSMYKSWSSPIEQNADKKEKKKEKTPSTKPENKPEEVKPNRVMQIQSLPTEDLYDMIIGGKNKAEQQLADKVLKERKDPIPKSFIRREDFKGPVAPETLKVLQEHIKNWDIHDFNTNMVELTNNQMQAEMAGNDRDVDYFRMIRNEYDRHKSELRKGNKPLLDVVQEALKNLDAPDSPFKEENRATLNDKARKWYQQAMFSSYNEVASSIDELNKELKEAKKGSNKQVYLTTLKEKVEKAQGKKFLDNATTSGRFLLKVQKISDGPLTDIDPDDYDLTDPSHIEDFVQKVGKLSDEDLANLVRDEPQYMMHFSFDPTDREAAGISSRNRSDFLLALERDLQMRGFLEQLDFSGKDTLDTEEFKKDQAKFEKFLATKPPEFHKKSWWDRFMEWFQGKQLGALRNSSANQHSFYRQSTYVAIRKELPTNKRRIASVVAKRYMVLTK